jgi:hypothetical protein
MGSSPEDIRNDIFPNCRFETSHEKRERDRKRDREREREREKEREKERERRKKGEMRGRKNVSVSLACTIVHQTPSLSLKTKQSDQRK